MNAMEKLSKTMAYALRHNPKQFNLTMHDDGSVELTSLVIALDTTLEDVLDVVATDQKGRYAVCDNRIWAVQGHSVPVNVRTNKLSNCRTTFHGTKVEFLDSIMAEGLKPNGRLFVHLSADFHTAVEVADRRDGESVILSIDTRKMIADGYGVFRADNGVILTSAVPWEYICCMSNIEGGEWVAQR